jgi:hypothetical protein
MFWRNRASGCESFEVHDPTFVGQFRVLLGKHSAEGDNAREANDYTRDTSHQRPDEHDEGSEVRPP